jgi:hypothetical protein
MEAVAVRLSIYPVSLVVVIFSVLHDPHHGSLSVSFIVLKISGIKIALLVYLHSHSISLIIQHLSLIYLSLRAGYHPLTVSLTIDDGANIHSVMIKSYLRSSID